MIRYTLNRQVKPVVGSLSIKLCKRWCIDIYIYSDEPTRNTAAMHDQLCYKLDIRFPELRILGIFICTSQGPKSKADISVHKTAQKPGIKK